MFNQVVVRRYDNTKIIDPGALAETLLFYDNVHVLFDAGSLGAILKSIGPDNLLRLMNEHRLTATVLTDNLGAQTRTTTFGESIYSF